MSSPFIQSKKSLPIVYSGLSLSTWVDSTTDDSTPDLTISSCKNFDDKNSLKKDEENLNKNFNYTQSIIETDKPSKKCYLFKKCII